MDTFTPEVARNKSRVANEEKLASAVGQGTGLLVTCRFYLRNECQKGTSCEYYHPARNDADNEPATNKTGRSETEHDDFIRAIHGAIVQFEDGGRVSRVSLPWEFSTLCLEGIPSASTAESVIQILQNAEQQIDSSSVNIIHGRPTGSTTKAFITVENPTFARDMCTYFRSPILKEPHLGITAIAVPPKLPILSSSRKISCRKVVVSWNEPTRLAWLNFGNERVATKVARAFNLGMYTICGKNVSAGPPTRGESGGPGAYTGRCILTVLLENVPYDATRHLINDSIKLEDRPRHVEISKGTGAYDEATAPIMVESLLSRIGPVNFTTLPYEPGKRHKAVAHFSDEADAREAVHRLHDQRQDFLDKGKLALQLMNVSTFKVLARICNHIGGQLHAKVDEWEKSHLRFKVYPGHGFNKLFTTLKIEGENPKEVATAAKFIEELIAGEKMKDGNETLWAPCLVANGPASGRLKNIEQDFGVTIVRNKAKKELRYFGPSGKLSAVRDAICADLKTNAQTTHSIPLGAEEFRWACSGGLRLIQAAIGGGAATLDVVSEPKKVFINGSIDQVRRAEDVIKRRKDLPTLETANSGGDCTICWTPAENAVTISCGHLYCLDCLEGMCMSADSGKGDLSVSCQGDMGKCQEILGIQELQDRLASSAFEEMLETSCASYLRRHPHQFRFCPSPDCDYIYRVTEHSNRHTCEKCLVVVCTACHEQHGFTSCADYKEIISGGYRELEKYKQKMGIKGCPKCKTLIEKTEGCNHMECKGCGAHICWVCLKTFDDSSPCYDHMNSAHGSIGLNYLGMLAV